MPRIPWRNNPVRKFGLWAGIVFLIAAAGLAAFARQSPPAKQAPITVSAAISLKDVLDQLGREYERDNPGAKVTFNYGGARRWTYFFRRRRSRWTRCNPRG
jgi:ABC-type molybdate transport system substrate-binding protein